MPKWAFDPKITKYELQSIPKDLFWKLWLWCKCEVKGQVMKPVKIGGIHPNLAHLPSSRAHLRSRPNLDHPSKNSSKHSPQSTRRNYQSHWKTNTDSARSRFSTFYRNNQSHARKHRKSENGARHQSKNNCPKNGPPATAYFSSFPKISAFSRNKNGTFINFARNRQTGTTVQLSNDSPISMSLALDMALFRPLRRSRGSAYR